MEDMLKKSSGVSNVQCTLSVEDNSVPRVERRQIEHREDAGESTKKVEVCPFSYLRKIILH